MKLHKGSDLEGDTGFPTEGRQRRQPWIVVWNQISEGRQRRHGTLAIPIIALNIGEEAERQLHKGPRKFKFEVHRQLIFQRPGHVLQQKLTVRSGRGPKTCIPEEYLTPTQSAPCRIVSPLVGLFGGRYRLKLDQMRSGPHQILSRPFLSSAQTGRTVKAGAINKATTLSFTIIQVGFVAVGIATPNS